MGGAVGAERRTMITFERDGIKFNFRVAGILIHKDRVLLHTTSEDPFWNLPGGRAELNEDTEQTIAREMKEELNIDVRVEGLGFIREDFFEYDGKRYHEIGFYYFLSIRDDEEITTFTDDFGGIEDNGRLIFRWVAIDALQELEVYPENLKSELLQRRAGYSGANHYIHHEGKK